MEPFNYSSDFSKKIMQEDRYADLGRQGENLSRRLVFPLKGIENPVRAKIIYAPSGHEKIETEAEVYSDAVLWTVPAAVTRYPVRGTLELIVTCADGAIYVPYFMETTVRHSLTGETV